MHIVNADYIKRIEIIKQLAELFVKFTGLDIQIIDIDNKPIKFLCLPNRTDKSICSNHILSGCNNITDDIFNELIFSNKTQVFKCRAGMTKILIPMILNGKVIGILFAGANNSSHLDGGKLNSVSKLLYRVVNYIIEMEVGSLKHFKGNILTRRQQILHNVVKYLKTNYHNNQISLREIASDNGISYHYLSHLFRKELGTSFVKYRMDVKMDAAAKFLKDFTLTVEQVSNTCGFTDSAYFSKAFKTAYGCPPGDFRRKILMRRGNGNGNGNGNGKKKITGKNGSLSKKLQQKDK